MQTRCLTPHWKIKSLPFGLRNGRFYADGTELGSECSTFTKHQRRHREKNCSVSAGHRDQAKTRV